MTKIYYFSGTGNSYWSAKKIAELSGDKCELFNIGTEADIANPVIEADAVVFVFPSYGYGLPLIVRRFAKSAIFKTPYFAAFVTFGSSPAGTLGEMRRILKKKKIPACYYGRIPAVENYIALFGDPKPEKIKLRLSMQEKATEEAAAAVLERRENSVNTFTPFSAFVSMLFYLGVKIFYNFYRVSDACSGCGKCVKICPVGAVVLKDKRPVFLKKCEHCQGCVDICPLRAIHFGRVNSATKGYHHPDVSI